MSTILENRIAINDKLILFTKYLIICEISFEHAPEQANIVYILAVMICNMR